MNSLAAGKSYDGLERRFLLVSFCLRAVAQRLRQEILILHIAVRFCTALAFFFPRLILIPSWALLFIFAKVVFHRRLVADKW